MAQVEEMTPLEEPSDRFSLVTSTVLGLTFAAVAFAASLWLPEAITGHRWWYAPADSWMVTQEARYVWSGALGYVYDAHNAFYALPLSAILLAPVVGLCDRLGMSYSIPFILPRPTAWLVMGPVTLLFAVPLLQASRTLAWELGRRRGLLRLQALMVPLVLVPMYIWGHFEDVLALTFTLYALRSSLRGQHVKAALLLSVAIASKQWSLLLLLMLVVRAPSGERFRAVVAGCALPGALAGLTLGVDWPAASAALIHPSTFLQNPEGHLALFAGAVSPGASRGLALPLAALIGWRVGRSSPVAFVCWAAILLMIRPLLEPIVFSYYYSPGLAVGCVALTGAAAHLRRRGWIAAFLAIGWASPFGGRVVWWWSAEAALLAALTASLLVAADFGKLRSAATNLVKHRQTGPIHHAMTNERLELI